MFEHNNTYSEIDDWWSTAKIFTEKSFWSKCSPPSFGMINWKQETTVTKQCIIMYVAIGREGAHSPTMDTPKTTNNTISWLYLLISQVTPSLPTATPSNFQAMTLLCTEVVVGRSTVLYIMYKVGNYETLNSIRLCLYHQS